MTAKYDHAKTVIDTHYSTTKKALMAHITNNSEDYAAQDVLLERLQSLRATQTAIANADKMQIVQHGSGGPSTKEVEVAADKALVDALGDGPTTAPAFIRTSATPTAGTSPTMASTQNAA